MTVDFLAIGHITHDLTPDGFRLGGTVSYAAVTALRLGRHPGILTRGSANGLIAGAAPTAAVDLIVPAGSPLAGVAIHLLPSPVSTTFTNIYRDGRRTQIIQALAKPIRPADLPAAWTAVPVALLGPIAREVPASWAGAFPAALVGVTPQGWMRRWDNQGHVSPTRWRNNAEVLRRADAILLSREDVGGDETYITALAQQTQLLVVTDGWHGATVYRGGKGYHVPGARHPRGDPPAPAMSSPPLF